MKSPYQQYITPNCQRNGKTQSGGRNLSPHLLQYAPWNMDWPHPYGRIHSQSPSPLHYRQILILPHARVWTTGYPQHHWNCPPSSPGRTLQKPWHIVKRSTCCAQVAQQLMKNRIKSKFTPFEVNDKVWLKARNLKWNILDPKFAPKWEGPFTITKVLSPLSYKLKLPTSWKIHLVFHTSLLTPYRENEIHRPNFPTPLPDLIDNEEEYEIEQILKHCGPSNNGSYLIRWKGYTAEKDTWLKEAELRNTTEFLYTYKVGCIHSPPGVTCMWLSVTWPITCCGNIPFSYNYCTIA